MKLFDPSKFLSKNNTQNNNHKTTKTLSQNGKSYDKFSCLQKRLKNLAQAPDGQKFYELRKVSFLFGGFVGGGLISFEEAERILKQAIDQKEGVRDYDLAYRTIRTCLLAGQNKPLFEDLEFKKQKKYLDELIDSEAKKSSKNQTEEMAEDGKEKLDTPYLPVDIYSQLPNLLSQGCQVFKDRRKKDVFLTGALAILSGCFDKISGLYDGKVYHANLNCFIVAPGASGKSGLEQAMTLGFKIHNHYLELNKEAAENFKKEYEIYNQKKNKGEEAEKPEEPVEVIFLIPGNTSSASLIEHLEDNNEIGIFCETEADTINNAMKQDWGSYSDMLRKAFHHERITYSRKGNNKRIYIEISRPQLAVALSGTFDQVPRLIQSAEDGLFSRIIFYVFNHNPFWRDVSPKGNGGINLDEYFNKLAEDVLDIHINQKKYEFKLTDEQWDKLNKIGEQRLKLIVNFFDKDAASTVFRLGLIQFRIAMILSQLRHLEKGNTEIKIVCEDIDYEISEKLTDVYLEHAKVMYSLLPKGSNPTLSKNLELFYNHLPLDKEFTRQEAIEIGKQVGISQRTVANYLKSLIEQEFLKQPFQYGPYRKA